MRRSADLQPDQAEAAAWWQDAVVYQVYVRSFADGDADGTGDLEGVRSRLGYLELLGVDTVWLTPFYPSPMAANGYDITDPRDIDPMFGDLAGFDKLVEEARAHRIRLIIDLVPGRTSVRHPWFVAALTSHPGDGQRDRYVFRQGRGFDGAMPPNNWTTVHGGPAWTRLPDGQWYLHLFGPTQPDLNWANPDVAGDFERTLRFWLDRGVAGVLINQAYGLITSPTLPDMDPRLGHYPGPLPARPEDPRFDGDGGHEVHRLIRRVLDTYPGRAAIGELSIADEQRFARYLRPDELHLAFQPRLMSTEFDADPVRAAIDQTLGAVTGVGAAASWALSGPDAVRHPTRYGGGELGMRRARAMALVELALPGSVFLYNGEELGLPDLDLPDWALRDPIWEKSGHTQRGRDGARVPIPWEGTTPPYGFTEGQDTWLPMPLEWANTTVEAQLEDPGSMLSLYRQAIELRQKHPALRGATLEWYGAPPNCFAFRRKGGGLICALNTSGSLVPLPAGEILLSSSPLVEGQLPPDTAVWMV